MNIKFYHFFNQNFEKGLIGLLSKIVEQDNNVCIIVDQDKIDYYDSKLWSATTFSFLPHLTENDQRLEQVPVIIASNYNDKNKPNVIVNIKSELISFDFLTDNNIDMLIEIIYSSDTDHINISRKKWKYYNEGNNIEIDYFKQDKNGKWNKS